MQAKSPVSSPPTKTATKNKTGLSTASPSKFKSAENTKKKKNQSHNIT